MYFASQHVLVCAWSVDINSGLIWKLDFSDLNLIWVSGTITCSEL